MILQVFPDYETLSKHAAQFVADAVRQKPDLVLGLAAGNSPVSTYREIIRMHEQEGLDLSRVVFFNLDEYGGLDPADPHSFTAFLQQNLLDGVHVNPANVHLLRFPASHVDEYCEDVEEAIRRAGGIDLQVLGIGRNGHIAFNEPGSSFASRTRVVKLAEPAPHFAKTAITMGTATILDAHRILLLASGADKADMLASAIEGPVTEMVPASILQLHANVTVMADASSAARLTRK